jgi:hypothetical protein
MKTPKKLLLLSFAVVLFCFLFSGFTYAEPLTSYPDTIYFEPAPDLRISANGDTFYIQPEGEDVKIKMNLKNQTPISAFTAPLMDKCYDGSIFLDPEKNNGSPLPQCFVGSRTVAVGWETHIIDLTLYPPQFMLAACLMTVPPLPAGDGPLATLTFTANDTGCVRADTFGNMLVPLTLVDEYSSGYTPEFIPRTFYVKFCPYNPGDLNLNDNVDITDVMFLIDYLFKEGEVPCPLKSADVNCDQRVSVSDAVYLIIYLFKNGSPPQTCEY